MPKPKRLGIHVIGPRYGESVILALPDGGIGVIDSFASRTHHPVMDFLKSQFPNQRELRFLALTHPHADHCYRIADLLGEFTVQEVWIFQPWPLFLVQRYFETLSDLGSPDEVEKAMGLPNGSVALSLLEFEKRVGALLKTKKIKYRALAGGRVFDLCAGQVKVHFLTPGDQQQYTYQTQLLKATKKMSADGKSLNNFDNLPTPDHNLASGALLVEFGKSRALLMADAEKELWDEWLASTPVAKLNPVHFVKSAHHGSLNGFHGGLYSEIADPATTIAVVTPFSKGVSPLPSEQGITSLRECVKNVYCTNRTVAAASSTLLWKAVTNRLLPSLPPPWVKQITSKRALAKLLVPEVGPKAPTGGPEPALPANWIADAQIKPSLWYLIRPDLRIPLPGLVAAEDYSVSAYLDNKGNVSEVKAGYEAGILS